MRIVIEGPDGAGKSNLIGRLTDRFPQLRLMARACTSEDGPIEQLGEWVEKDVRVDTDELIGRHRLYDRHPLISELIYSPALGRPLNEAFQDEKWLVQQLRQFRSMNYWVVYCLPDKAVVHDNILRTHSADTDHVRALIRNIDRVYDLYFVRWCMEADKFGRMRWNYSQDVWPLWVQKFDRVLDKEK